jgi:hypothetical protein
MGSMVGKTYPAISSMENLTNGKESAACEAKAG